MSYKKIAGVRRRKAHVANSKRADEIYPKYEIGCLLYLIHTSWMFGNSRSSAKTKTPGADVASWISLAAAAPLADLDMSRNGSSRAAEFPSSSMVKLWSSGLWRGNFVAAALQGEKFPILIADRFRLNRTI